MNWTIDSYPKLDIACKDESFSYKVLDLCFLLYDIGGNTYFSFESYGTSARYDAIGSVRQDNNISSLFFNTRNAGSNIERMRITSGGNVLIGTTTDAGYKLDVNGTGRLKSTLIIDGNNGTGAGQIFLKNEGGDYTTQIGTNAYNLYLQTRGISNVFQFWDRKSTCLNSSHRT